MKPEAPIERIELRCFRVPTETPEADGTLNWDATTMLLVTVHAGGASGIGYSYSGTAAAGLLRDTLSEAVEGIDAFDVPAAWAAMIRSVRNLGWAGLCASAVSAVDAALWDLKAKLLGLPLVSLLGSERTSVSINGSGGFTNYDNARLCNQLSGWVEREGCPAVKMKIGREPDRDTGRVRQASDAIGGAHLYVDANGAMSRKEALAFAEVWHELGVTWFEKPACSGGCRPPVAE